MHLQKDFDPSSSEMKDYGSEDIEHESSIQKILLKPTSTDGVIEKSINFNFKWTMNI